MGRRKKPRQVRHKPTAPFFAPHGGPATGALRGVPLSVEGLEAMTLADGEGMAQKDAAAMMGISRPTFNRILGEARRAVATALSNGWAIRIHGGQYAVPPLAAPCPNAGRPGHCAVVPMRIER